MEEELLDAKKVAERFSYSKSKLYKEIREGRFPKPIAIGGRDQYGRAHNSRWPKSQIEAFIQETIDQATEV